ncbi:MAG: hypothetical protein GF334_11905 [Candidatus Altiarchaeales archaeon]|nr:hypothetical protein [Candidatus Altiarchaeales archaeon]
MSWIQFIAAGLIILLFNHFPLLAETPSTKGGDFTLGERHKINSCGEKQVFGVRVQTKAGEPETTRYFAKTRLTDGFYVVDAVEPPRGFTPQKAIEYYYLRGFFEDSGYFQIQSTKFFSKFSGLYHVSWEWLYCERKKKTKRRLPLESFSDPNRLPLTSIGFNLDFFHHPLLLLDKSLVFRGFHSQYRKYVLFRREGLNHTQSLDYVNLSYYGVNLTSKAYYDAYEKSETVDWLKQASKTTGLYDYMLV